MTKGTDIVAFAHQDLLELTAKQESSYTVYYSTVIILCARMGDAWLAIDATIASVPVLITRDLPGVMVIGLDGVFVTEALSKDSVKMSMRLPVLFRAVIFKLK